MTLAPSLDHPLELLDRLLDDGQRDHRHGEDPVLEVEGPVLVHPLVEGVDHDVGGFRVVAEALLEEAGERGPHQGPVDAQLVHELEARPGLAERRRRVDAPAHDLAAALAVGVAGLEVLLLGAGRRDPLEGGVGDVLADRALHRDLRAAVDLDVADEPGVLRREVAGERVGRLVHVVVGVEDREVELAGWHGRPLLGE